MIIALRAPADGPLGDSALVVDDGTARILNKNDARPIDLDVLRAVRPVRRAHAAVLRRDLVADGLRHADRGEGRVRRGEAGQRQMDRATAVHQGGRGQVHGAVGGPALLPR